MFMGEGALHPRHLCPRIVEALADSPVVLIHGPRQCGKTTLARLVGDEAGFAYFTFDDWAMHMTQPTPRGCGFSRDAMGAGSTWTDC